MAGHDESVHGACLPFRSWAQGFGSTGGIHVYHVRAEKVPKAPQRDRLRNAVVMPESVKRLGDHEIRHDHLFTDEQRAFDPPARDLRLRVWLPDQQAEHDRGIKPDGHWSIHGRCSDECR